jgi:hypothetical protein
VGQDFDRSDISIHEAQPALRRTAKVSKVPQRFDDFILYHRNISLYKMNKNMSEDNQPYL